jgi:hypothetical protein
VTNTHAARAGIAMLRQGGVAGEQHHRRDRKIEAQSFH